MEFEEYYTQCGELYLTVKGNIVFHCILCEGIYKDFTAYSDHTKIHYEKYADEIKEEEDHLDQTNSLELQTIEYNEHDDGEEFMKQDSPNLTVFKKEASIDITIERLENHTTLLESPKAVNHQIRPKLQNKAINPNLRDRKFKCTYCDYACCDKSNINLHIKRHSKEKKHKCTLCIKTFHTSTELKTHFRTHTGERPFLCTECGLRFLTSGKLSSHRKRKHTFVKDKICSMCEKSFFSLYSLREHQLVHTNKRDYKCSECDATFKTCVTFRNHKRIHENKKSYECKICHAKFNQNAGLYSHMKNYHTVLG